MTQLLWKYSYSLTSSSSPPFINPADYAALEVVPQEVYEPTLKDLPAAAIPPQGLNILASKPCRLVSGMQCTSGSILGCPISPHSVGPHIHHVSHMTPVAQNHQQHDTIDQLTAKNCTTSIISSEHN